MKLLFRFLVVGLLLCLYVVILCGTERFNIKKIVVSTLSSLTSFDQKENTNKNKLKKKNQEDINRVVAGTTTRLGGARKPDTKQANRLKKEGSNDKRKQQHHDGGYPQSGSSKSNVELQQQNNRMIDKGRTTFHKERTPVHHEEEEATTTLAKTNNNNKEEETVLLLLNDLEEGLIHQMRVANRDDGIQQTNLNHDYTHDTSSTSSGTIATAKKRIRSDSSSTYNAYRHDHKKKKKKKQKQKMKMMTTKKRNNKEHKLPVATVISSIFGGDGDEHYYSMIQLANDDPELLDNSKQETTLSKKKNDSKTTLDTGSILPNNDEDTKHLNSRNNIHDPATTTTTTTTTTKEDTRTSTVGATIRSSPEKQERKGNKKPPHPTTTTTTNEESLPSSVVQKADMGDSSMTAVPEEEEDNSAASSTTSSSSSTLKNRKKKQRNRKKHKRHHGREPTTYYHPTLDDVLPVVTSDSQQQQKQSSFVLDPADDQPPQPQSPHNNNKPHLIIHIGPSKTGTSTIQKESASDLFRQALQTDRYVYLGKFAQERRQRYHVSGLFHPDSCFRQARRNVNANTTTSFLQTKCWQQRVKGIEELRNQNRSIVLSDETYSYHSAVHFDYRGLRMAFGEDWNVLVVPTYRRYYEWVLSAAKEINRVHCHRKDVAWQDGKCANLWTKVKEYYYSGDEGTFGARMYKNLDVTIPLWKYAGFNVSVLDFHDNQRHITCSLYCDVLPNTPNVCQVCLQQPHPEHQNHQEAAMTAYNDIVYEAAKRGLIQINNNNTNDTMENNFQQTRHQVTNDLANYHHITLGKRGLEDLPLLCPPRNMLESLLEKSLDLERKLLPHLPVRYHRRHDSTGSTREKQHIAAFWEAADQHKVFCSVDIDTLFVGLTSWEQVLDRLNTTTGQST